MKKAQIVVVRGESFFVCDYTGALTKKRYFVPRGKRLKSKDGCFANLPILLRHHFEENACEFTPKFNDVKRSVEEYYLQPDIPMAPHLDKERIPLSVDELADYMSKLEMGHAWDLVPTEEVGPKRKKISEEPDEDPLDFNKS